MALDPFCVVYCELHLEKDIRLKLIDAQGYIAVSDVGRIAIGSSRSELPLRLLNKLMSKQNARNNIRSGYPGNFRRKAFDVILFSLQNF